MIKKIIALAIFIVSINGYSQKNNISPYSFFGIGDIADTKSVFEQNMGGVGTAFKSSYRIGFSNPASLAALKLTTYTLAANNNFIVIDDGINKKQNSSSFALKTLALGFPVGKKGGASFGLQPYSKVGYQILNKYQNDIDETESDLFTGEGATNRVYIGYGYELPYNINLGVEASYIFGHQERAILHRDDEHLDRLATRYRILSNISGFSFKFGGQNSFKINEKLNLETGFTVILESNLNDKGNESLISLTNSPNPEILEPRDFILDNDFEGTIVSPIKSTYSIGLGETNKWFAGFEYSMQNALTIPSTFTQNNNTIAYGDSNNLAFGGHYTPKAESITNYWDRVTYSAGTHLKQTGLIVNNNEIKDFGISFGVSLPSKRQLSNINLGFDIGQRGEIDNSGLIKENYYNFRLSLSLNDKWFKKRKLD
ncbi:MAG: hypothetical protein V3U80_03165 [Flavobacteriaceae bacterium]